MFSAAVGSMATILGKVSVSWTRADSAKEDALTPASAAKLAVTIPAGATARVTMPCADSTATTITESGKVIWKAGKFVPGAKGVTESEEQVLNGVTLEIESGSYVFAQ